MGGIDPLVVVIATGLAAAVGAGFGFFMGRIFMKRSIIRLLSIVPCKKEEVETIARIQSHIKRFQ